MKRAMKMIGALAILLAVAAITPNLGWAQSAGQSGDAGGFIRKLTGEWVGTYEQYTNGKKADTKYCHAIVKQSGPDAYVTVMEYYRLDAQTGAPVKIGQSTMTTEIAPDGTATNSITGKGTVFIDPKTQKPEEHDLTEALRVSGNGGLEGAGTGKISVSGMALGLGKNGDVRDSRSAWSMNNGVLKISQDLKVSFKVLLFSKSFDVRATFTAKRGSDISGLMMAAKDASPGHEEA